MKIAVLGAGHVGRTLGTALSAAGHDVRFGVPNPSRHPDLPGAADVAPAIDSATGPDGVIVFAVPGRAVPELLEQHGSRLDGALLIDATNQVGQAALHQLPVLTTALPGARIARAFCTAGVEVMTQPVIGGQRADSVWCGPDGADAVTIETLIADVGFRPVRAGGLDAADVVDGVTRLWFALAVGGWGRHSGIQVLGSRTA
jgi:predicted dinucleotide-binding enzyme